VIPDSPGPSSDDDEDLASVVLAQLSHVQRDALLQRAAHIREVLTGYRSGSPEMAEEGEPRSQYAPDRPLYERYADKAAELGITRRTIQRWVQGFQRRGEAGLVGGDQFSQRRAPKVDDRWAETALEVMAEHTGESKPSRTLVIDRTQARVIARFGATRASSLRPQNPSPVKTHRGRLGRRGSSSTGRLASDGRTVLLGPLDGKDRRSLPEQADSSLLDSDGIVSF
jgi:hypothetical protein